MIRISTFLTVLAYAISILGVAPVFLHLDLIPRLFIAAALVAGIIMDKKDRYHVQGLAATLLAMAFFVFYALRISSDNLIIPAANLLVILLSIRLLGKKTARNHLQVLALSLFALAGSSLLSQDMSFIFYLVPMMLCTAMLLVLSAFLTYGSKQSVSLADLKQILSVSLLMPVVSIPVLLLFFFILPRTQYPLWNFLNTAGEQVAGFSETVEPGSASRVGAVKTVVLRAQSPRLNADELYWRGIVLNTVKDNVWGRSKNPIAEHAYVVRGKEVKQLIFPEPNTSPYLILLNVPNRLSGIRAVQDADFVFRRRDAQASRRQIESVAILSDVIAVKGKIDREAYLSIPSNLSEQVKSLGRYLLSNAVNDIDKVSVLKQYFVSQKFTYATSNLPRGPDPVAAFMFGVKTGNCEFFASSFAVLLRVMGIPSRLVGGYYGGVYNALGEYYVVTEDMAHVWVEAYLEGEGWRKIDPSAFSANFSRSSVASASDSYSRLQLLSDSMNYFWNLAIINYNLEKQFSVARKTHGMLKKVDITLGYTTLVSLAVTILGAIVITLGYRRLTRSREENLVSAFMKKIKQKYPLLEVTTATSLQELAETINDPQVRSFAAIYCAAVYQDRKLSDSECKALREIVAKL
jgi:protein-glutamine gamma-glutamyltransferase